MIQFIINTIAYEFTDQEGSDRDFQRSPIQDTQTLIGTGESEYHLLGFSPPRRSINALIQSEFDYLGLRNSLGLVGMINDDESYINTTVRMVGFNVNRKKTGDIWTGTIVFEIPAGF